MTPAGSPGTAGRGFRIPAKEGRHRAPPPPPTPPKFLPLYTPIGAAAALLTGLSLIAIVAPGFGYDATATDRGVTVPTASRTARTVHIPLTVLPPAATAMSTATPSAPRDAHQTWAGVSVVAEAAVTTAAGSSEVTRATEAMTDRPPTTLPEVAATDSTTPSSPASTSEVAAASSAPTSTEETTPMTTEPTQTAEPTDVIGDVAHVIGEVGP